MNRFFLATVFSSLALCQVACRTEPPAEGAREPVAQAVPASTPAESNSGPSVAMAWGDEKPAPKADTKPAAKPTAEKKLAADSKKDEKPPVAATKAEIGKPAPDFSLTTVDGKTVKLSDYKGKTVVLEWFNPGCPYCVYAYGEGGPLRDLPERLMSQGIVWLSINSQDGSAVDDNKAFMKANGMKAPLLMDPTGAVGKMFGAKSTPHCFVINEKGLLVYAGGLDNAPKGKVKDTETKTNYVEAAIKDLKGGHAVTISETKQYG